MIPCPTTTWLHGGLRLARRPYGCDYVNHTPGSGRCDLAILPGDYYFDPGEKNPSEAGGFGNYRYCLACGHAGCPNNEQVAKLLAMEAL